MNIVSMIGRLTRDPELKQTQSGVAVCSFSIAVDRKFKNASGERETDFVNCTAWRQTAEFIAKYMPKGQRIGITGSLQSRQYEDKQGNKRTAWEVQVDGAYFADGKAEPPSGGSQYSDSCKPKAGTNNFKAEYVQDTLDETALPFDL